MSKNTSITLSKHFDGFIAHQIEAGRYSNVSEVIRSGLRMLEEHETKVEALRAALIEAEEGGDAGALDFDEIRSKARERAGLTPDGA